MATTGSNNSPMNPKEGSRLRRLVRQQFGSSDVEMIVFIVVLVTLATVAYLLLGWVKSVKDERVESNAQNYREYMKRKNQRPKDREPASEQLVF